MTAALRVTILGSGTSSGVPRIGPDGADWGACDPNEPRNSRRRVSLLVQHGDYSVLIDTSPDLRAQLIDARCGRLDAVLYTHDHADHANGIDDLRQVFHNQRKPVDCYATAPTLATLQRRFGYAFNGAPGYPPTCAGYVMPDQLRFGAMTITPFEQQHGGITSLGFRFEAAGVALAYSTDLDALPQAAHACVRGLDMWIVDGLRRAPHPTHTHLARTLEWIATFKPERALLTHMDNSMDYATLCAELPEGVAPAYDGQVLTLGDI